MVVLATVVAHSKTVKATKQSGGNSEK